MIASFFFVYPTLLFVTKGSNDLQTIYISYWEYDLSFFCRYYPEIISQFPQQRDNKNVSKTQYCKI